MNISNILMVLNTYIEESEQKIKYREIEIENLKRRIEKLEKEKKC